MALMIDTPLWPWRGHLWAHMISDESLDELHVAARKLNLRWVAFGLDHYDIPDVLWPKACEVAELVDSRVIVRSLRSSGLRVGGGKSVKSWQRLADLPDRYRDGHVADWLHRVRPRFDDVAIEVLARPSELVVMHLTRSPHAPALDGLLDGPGGPVTSQVVHTVADNRYSLELVLPWD